MGLFKKIGKAVKRGAGKLALAVTGVKIKKTTAKKTSKKPIQAARATTKPKKVVIKKKKTVPDTARSQTKLKAAYKKRPAIVSKPQKPGTTIVNKYAPPAKKAALKSVSTSAGALAGAVENVATPEGVKWYWLVLGALFGIGGLWLLVRRKK